MEQERERKREKKNRIVNGKLHFTSVDAAQLSYAMSYD